METNNQYFFVMHLRTQRCLQTLRNVSGHINLHSHTYHTNIQVNRRIAMVCFASSKKFVPLEDIPAKSASVSVQLDKPEKKWFSKEKDKNTNLQSFLKHQEEQNKDQDTAYFRGTKYELQVVDFLRTLHFDIQKTGQTRDGGVDFTGKWLLPDKSLPVIGQCKREAQKSGPKYIRELEGTIFHQTALLNSNSNSNNNNDNNTLGVFVSFSGFSKDSYKHFLQSLQPMILCGIDNSGQLTQFALNAKAKILLPNLVIGEKRIPTNSNAIQQTKSLKGNKTVRLFYNGEEISKM